MLQPGRPIYKLESMGFDLKLFVHANLLQKLDDNDIFMIPSTKKADSEIAAIKKNNENFAISSFLLMSSMSYSINEVDTLPVG